MTKKKMCPKYLYKDGEYCCYPGDKICPKNTNSKCEIIPAKPRYKRVKAWAMLSFHDGIFAGTKHFSDEQMPCTITIAAKYLKEKRK